MVPEVTPVMLPADPLTHQKIIGSPEDLGSDAFFGQQGIERLEIPLARKARPHSPRIVGNVGIHARPDLPVAHHVDDHGVPPGLVIVRGRQEKTLAAEMAK